MKEKAIEQALVMSSEQYNNAVSDAYEKGAEDGFKKAVEMLKHAKMDNYHNKLAERFAGYLEANAAEIKN